MTGMKEFVHETVLLREAVKGLEPVAGGRYIDCTLGGAGHTRLLLQESAPNGQVLALDQDDFALQTARLALTQDQHRIRLVHANFRTVASVAREVGFESVDGVVFDLGVSSPQFDEAERGFSYRFDAPLDMRMDTTQKTTAELLVNQLSELELANVFFRYGEERFSRRIAKRIVEKREQAPINNTLQLADIIAEAIPAAARRTGPHPARRVFQALRIAVNDELEALREGLQGALQVLRPGGRIAVITFHSLEDRIVKQTFQDWAKGCICPPDFPVCLCQRVPEVRILTKKPRLPSDSEILQNPRARSAKLRIAEKWNE